MMIYYGKSQLVKTVLLAMLVLLIIGTVSATEQRNTTDENSINEDCTTITNDNTEQSYNKIIEQDTSEKSYDITKNTQTKTKEDDANTKIDPDIRLSNSEIHPGVNKTFLAILPYDATGTAYYKINKTKISNNIKVEDGQVMYTYEIPKTFNSEHYTLYIVYSGDSQYKAKTANATLTLTPEGGKVNATMTMKNYTGKYLSKQTFKVKLNKTATGTVVFKIGNKTISTVKIKDGVATTNYTIKKVAGVYNLTATYNGNYMYVPTTINSTFTVTKLKTYTTIKNASVKPGNSTILKATAIDELGRYVKNTDIKFKINSKVIGTNKTNSKGVATYNYTLPTAYNKKTYNLTAICFSTNTTATSKNQSTLTSKQLKTKTLVPDISTIPSKYVVITATVVDDFNNYVSRGYVTFKKGNTTIKTVKVSNGFATYKYQTNYQTYSTTNLYASYVGDWKYSNSSGKGKFKITKLKTTAILSSIDAKPNTKITFTARIRDQNQNAAKEGKVKFRLNNKFIGTADVKNGLATIKYSLKSCAAGSYRIKCEYYGSKIYKNSSNTNTLSVTRYDTSISGDSINAVVGSPTPISVNVIDEENYNVNNGTVKFYVNNDYVGSAKVSKGVATLKYSAPSKYDGKTVKYYVTYEKNGIYDSCSYTNTILVSHQKTVYVSVNGSDSNLGDKNHPFRTIKHALSHITLFGTIRLSEGTFSESGIKLNTSVNLIGSGRYKTIINGGKSGVPIFNITKRNAVLSIKSLTLKNGVSNRQFSAGAIVTSGKLNIQNTFFVNNTGNGLYSGGAIYTNGILNLTTCEFRNNAVTNINSQGGAIRCYDNMTYITNCSFYSNKVTGSNSTGGSVIYCDSGDMIINGTRFIQNSVTGKYVTGGVIRTISGALVIDKSTFTDNSIEATNYAMGGIVGSLSSGVSIMNSIISSNTIKATNSGGGSVVYVEVAALDIKNTKISSNGLTTKNAYGGAIYGYLASITLNKNVMNNNFISSTENGMGGAIYVYGGNLSIIKTNFTSNNVKSKGLALAGAIYSSSNIMIKQSNFIKNNVNGSNLGGGAIANMGVLNITNTNFINNSALNAGNAITATNSSTNHIEKNYWGSASPKWNETLYCVTKPTTYSKTKINN